MAEVLAFKPFAQKKKQKKNIKLDSSIPALTHTYMYTHAHSFTYTHSYTHSYTCTLTRTHTHTHTHSQPTAVCEGSW